MTEHISQGELALYVVEGLDEARASRLEAHVIGCGACGAALATEAALEIAFEQIARTSSAVAEEGRPPFPRRSGAMGALVRPGWAVATAGGLSLAAAWVLLLVSATRAPPRAAGGSRVQGAPAGYAALPSDATTSAIDGRSFDPLDGG
jgi:hypothetical protein